MRLRNATTQDCPAILEIINEEIRDRLATFKSIERKVEDLIDELAWKQERAMPMFVAEGPDGQILGYGTYGLFRSGEGYAYTMEHTIMLAAAGQGQGIGRAIMAALEDHARANGVHSLVAAVSAANDPGVRFHAALGYETVGTMPEAGFKGGKWLDLVLMQKLL